MQSLRNWRRPLPKREKGKKPYSTKGLRPNSRRGGKPTCALAADFDLYWQAADELAERGIASAYDKVKRALVDLSEAYALCAARADFDRKLVEFMAQHGKRSALVRRLADAGLWK